VRGLISALATRDQNYQALRYKAKEEEEEAHTWTDISKRHKGKGILVQGSLPFQIAITAVRRDKRCVSSNRQSDWWCSEERRQLEPELAFWSKFASAKAAQVLSGASVTTVRLFFFVIGRLELD